MLSSILIFQSVSRNTFTALSNNILVNNNLFNFGQKASNLNTIIVDKDLFVYQKQSHLFIYTDSAKQSQINVQMNSVNVFAVFGFNVNNQDIMHSTINISIKFSVITGALICLMCDIQVQNSSLSFIASGKQVSGVMIESMSKIFLKSTLLQFRFNSSLSSGIVNLINQIVEITLTNITLTGYNFLQSSNNGLIVSDLKSNISVALDLAFTCSATPITGNTNFSLILTNNFTQKCKICQTGSLVYGICSDDLQFGQIVNGNLQCVYPFEYYNKKCQCASGYLLNVSVCIDLIKEIDKRSTSNVDYSVQLNEIEQNLNDFVTNQTTINLLLNQYIVNNASALNASIYANNDYLEHNIINNRTQTQVLIDALNTSVNDKIYVQNQIIAALQDQLNVLIKKFDYNPNPTNNTQSDVTINDSPVNIYINISVNSTYINNDLVCLTQTYTTTFDIAAITNQVLSTDFATGYVFSTSNVISNAFINIQDSVYSAVVLPLFQTQNSFNQIKIQIGTQAAGSGSILANGNTLTINTLNIISKDGSQITVNTTSYKLNILQIKTIIGSFTNLLLSLSFASSQGSIYLIGNVVGTLNITNYHILGSYQSTNQIALGSPLVNNSQIFLNNVNFVPQTYNPGNVSSYFFSIVNTSSVNICNISIVLGNNQNAQALNFPATTTSYTYQFGGLIAQLNSTPVAIQDVIHNSNVSYSILYVSNSGLIIGRSGLANNTIIIQRICFQLTLKSNTIFSQFGLIGFFEGTIQFVSSNIQFSIQNINTSTNIASIGQTSTLCPFSIFQNIRIIATITVDTANYLSSLIALNQSPNCTILNTTVQSSNISTTSFAGGLIGWCSSLVTIQYTSVFNSNISVIATYAGGFFGLAYSNIQITNSSVQNTTFNQNSQVGGFIGTLQAGSTLLLSICQIFNITITAKVHVGGLVGFADYSSSIVFSDSLVSNSSIIGTSSNAGGFIGTFSQNYYACTLKIVTSKISSIKVSSPTNFGIAVGYKYPAYSVANSILEGENYVNNVKQFNCVNFATTC
ncbi:Conserved_hypothetical protein [Hexamita inflata]|uniref:Uncharacterized protein n=1 Tax=Hexamita inflata TaxID=28002 RepID=A0AA86QPE9_9EUKA|nr:Conserved hypothetical protein [Hexamita inflata]